MEKSLQPLIKSIKSGKKVTFFLGAGISTSAGIPDFRSPETGLYSNLSKLNLPFAEAVFDIDYFKEHPQAFYTLADELYPGKFVPTPFHYFVRLLQDKGHLHRVYTQNIDTLERIAGVKEEYIVEAHGSFAYNHCIDCNEEMSTAELKKQMQNGKPSDKKSHKHVGVPTCPKCKGYVKPDIVFFGEGLPARFFDSWDEDSEEVEIAIVAGTSLSVYPFASLPSEVNKDALRVLINNEAVGDFVKSSKRRTDILALHSCDEVAKTISKLLGWEDELDELISSATKDESKKTAEVESKELSGAIAKEIKEAVEVKSETPAAKDKEPKQDEAGKDQSAEKDEKKDDIVDDLSKLKI